MLRVVGGAGLIGSNIVATLDDAGSADLAVCDHLGHGGKWRKLASRRPADLLCIAVFELDAASRHPAGFSTTSIVARAYGGLT